MTLPHTHRCSAIEANIIRFEPSTLCDFTIDLTDETTGVRHIFYTHKHMLAIRCKYFQRIVEENRTIDTIDLNNTPAHQYGCSVLEDLLRLIYTTELKQYIVSIIHERKNLAAIFHVAMFFEYNELLQCSEAAVNAISPLEYLYQTFKHAVNMNVNVLIDKCVQSIANRRCLEQLLIIAGGVDQFVKDLSTDILLRIFRCQVEGKCAVDHDLERNMSAGKEQREYESKEPTS